MELQDFNVVDGTEGRSETMWGNRLGRMTSLRYFAWSVALPSTPLDHIDVDTLYRAPNGMPHGDGNLLLRRKPYDLRIVRSLCAPTT